MISRSLMTITYADARPLILDGDLIFCRGRKWLHWLFRVFTGGYFNHVALVFRWGGDRLYVVESGERGVVSIPLSKFLNAYPGEVIWARCSAVTNDNVSMVRDAATDALFGRYATGAIMRLAVRKLLKRTARLLGIKWQPPKDDRYYCSELVAFALNRAGVQFAFDSEGAISPGDIAEHLSIDGLAKLKG